MIPLCRSSDAKIGRPRKRLGLNRTSWIARSESWSKQRDERFRMNGESRLTTEGERKGAERTVVTDEETAGIGTAAIAGDAAIIEGGTEAGAGVAAEVAETPPGPGGRGRRKSDPAAPVPRKGLLLSQQ